MTGYGRSTWEEGTFTIDAEIRTVNSRYLNIITKLPAEIFSWEPQIKKIMGESLTRGSVNIIISYVDSSKRNFPVIDKDLLLFYYKSLKKIAIEAGDQVPSIASFLNLPGVINIDNMPPCISQEKWEKIREVFLKALSNMEKMRQEEGEYLRKEIEQYCLEIEKKINRIEELAPSVYEYYLEKIKSKILEFSRHEKVEIPEESILKEIAQLFEKNDITEEIVRFKSHVVQFKATMNWKEANGKKLEFLLQEMLREITTISSKINNKECSTLVVDLKSLLEKIREQIQNIE